MINARMMYLRPGNLFKQFTIEECVETTSDSGRPTTRYESDGTKTLFGCLASVTEEDHAHDTADHIITHTLVQAGKPRAKRTDRLTREGRVFYVVDLDETGMLNETTLYYVEERTDVK